MFGMHLAEKLKTKVEQGEKGMSDPTPDPSGRAQLACKKCGLHRTLAISTLGVHIGWYECSACGPIVTLPLNPCPDCKASPCDCNATVWSFSMRNKDTRSQEWMGSLSVSPPSPAFTRRETVSNWDAFSRPHGAYDCGPVQRITEPPYEFPPRPGDVVDAEYPEVGEKANTSKDLATYNATIPTCETCGAIAYNWEILNGKGACVHCWKRHAQTLLRHGRANTLADRCQTLEDEKRELLAENATLRRRVERLERKR
jgi:hypothetical protein